MSSMPIRSASWRAGLALLMWPVALHAAQPLDSLARNPSCEAAGEGGRPVGWSYSYSSGGACDFAVDREVKRSGKGSIRLANH